MKFIPYGRQDITEEDINVVIKTLRSDFITQGPKVEEFESGLRGLTNAKYSFAVNSATSGLHIACLALGLEKNDIVWTSPITFVASSNCALYEGALVDFVDIDIDTLNISVCALENKLIEAKRDNILPKILIPVHMCGQSCDMERIYELSRVYGFSIIEDASHAIGGKYLNSSVGSCQYSDITVFSFHPVKIITTAEGGACLTNDSSIAQKLELLRSHGVTRSSELLENKNEGPWYYEQHSLGFNYRMTDIQAALGSSQLERIENIILKRNEIAKIYTEKLSSFVECPQINDKIISSFHLFVIQVPSEIRKEVFIKLRSKGIGVNVHYYPVYLQPYYKKLGFSEGYCPLAEKYYSKAISIPMHPTLTTDEISYVCDTIIEAVS